MLYSALVLNMLQQKFLFWFAYILWNNFIQFYLYKPKSNQRIPESFSSTNILPCTGTKIHKFGSNNFI